MKKTNNNLAVLTSIFCVCLILSNILACKILSFVNGLIVVPSAVVVYWLTYLMTDVIGEIWGREQANETVKTGFICQIIAIILIFIATILPVAPFSDNQAEFETILGSTARVTIASMISYFVSQSWDIFVFHKLKDIFPNKKWIRNNVGTMTSQIIDTFIFIFIAFYGKVPSIVTMAISQYIVKFFLAILDTPIFYLLTKNNEKEVNP